MFETVLSAHPNRVSGDSLVKTGVSEGRGGQPFVPQLDDCFARKLGVCPQCWWPCKKALWKGDMAGQERRA